MRTAGALYIYGESSEYALAVAHRLKIKCDAMLSRIHEAKENSKWDPQRNLHLIISRNKECMLA